MSALQDTGRHGDEGKVKPRVSERKRDRSHLIGKSKLSNMLVLFVVTNVNVK